MTRRGTEILDHLDTIATITTEDRMKRKEN
jgi:hypothetical protein